MPATLTKITKRSDWDETYLTEGYIYIQAVATIVITHEDLDHDVIQEISSPGLYGIDDNSPDEYLEDIYADEREILLVMLRELGVDVG